ncbi:MAG: cytochrome b/b6 domain-containing protein [Rhizobiaceae bacterium]|jgi:cytochrome b|nr:cytochrome b/b6 domain-containing protein [Rhizobiaceae bacterium]
MVRIAVWDPFVRIFHWSLAGLFAANALFLDPETTLHRQVGYAAAALIALRLVWGVIGSRHARFRDFPPSLKGALGQISDLATGRRSLHVGHTPLGAFMIYNLLATVAAIAASGWLMTTDAFWGVAWVEEVHEAAVLWAEVSIVLHVAAVILESLRMQINLPKAMVTGVKIMPGPH